MTSAPLTPDPEPDPEPVPLLDHAALARTMVELADTLVDDFDVVELLTRLTKGCVDLLGVGAAGLVLLGAQGELEVVASSNDTTQMLEFIELQSNDGPCMDCYRSGLPLSAEDVRFDQRWPDFSKAATAAGFRAVHAFPLRHRGIVVGALNLFCEDSGQLAPEARAVAQALADLATIGVLHHQELEEAQVLNEQLQRALDSRVVIEQAKGVTADRLRLDVDAAFGRLRDHARRHNLRLIHVAEDVVSGRLSPHALD